MKKKVYITIFLLAAVLTAAAQDYTEKYRPQYHFSPVRGWIGDPDGLVYTGGQFHLYWWGHASSPDLVHWQEYPRPMKGGDGSFSYFSGSVAVDANDTAGFGRGSMLAFYTMHFPGDSIPETQAISVSRDGGMSYHFYEKNPILDIGQVFFRDPQVFWYEPDGQWKMVVSRPDVQLIYIYESDNLLDWTFCSVFGGLGATGAFWECPDLFEIPVLGADIKKWVMLIGRGPNRVQYFAGDFDGNTFTPDKNIADYLQRPVETSEGMPEHALWLDYGDDYYATRTWRSYDEARPLADTVYAIGWMGNWDYARNAPTSWGKGFQSLPRTMFLKDTPEGYRVVQRPVPQLRQLRGEHFSAKKLKVRESMELNGFAGHGNTYEMIVEFQPSTAGTFGVELLKGEGRSLVLSYDPAAQILTLDRTACTDFTSDAEFTKNFASKMKAPATLDTDGKLKLHIFVDKASVEVFVGDGETVMSAVTYPSDAQTGIEFFATGGTAEVALVEAWKLDSIWK